MKKVYPVLFTQTKECVLVEVPDLEILTEGKNVNDAIDMVRDAIELKYVTMEDEKIEIAEPSNIWDINISSGTFADEGQTILSMVDVNPSEYRRRIDSKPVRRNVSLPGWLDYAAEKAGINVSRVLQESLIQKLGLQKRS